MYEGFISGLYCSNSSLSLANKKPTVAKVNLTLYWSLKSNNLYTISGTLLRLDLKLSNVRTSNTPQNNSKSNDIIKFPFVAFI